MSPSRRTLIATAAVIGVVALVLGVIKWSAPLRGMLSLESRTTMSQDMVVQEVRSVAKLVTSETTIRDVVVWQNTQYGSTKRALVVVTGKVLAGFDLSQGTSVTVNDTTRTITISLPAPKVIAVDVTQMKTYDEQSGLWNWFKPSDRDQIYQNARAHLAQSANEMGMAEHAGRSAIEMLTPMFSTNGYRAVVTVAGLAPVEKAD